MPFNVTIRAGRVARREVFKVSLRGPEWLKVMWNENGEPHELELEKDKVSICTNLWQTPLCSVQHRHKSQ